MYGKFCWFVKNVVGKLIICIWLRFYNICMLNFVDFLKIVVGKLIICKWLRFYNLCMVNFVEL